MVRVFFSAAAGLAAVAASAADLTIVSKLTHNGQSQTATSYVSADKLRMASGVDNEVIVDFAKAQFTVIDNAKKEYFVITKQDMEDAVAQMKAMQEQMAPQRKQMEEQMKNLPPAMREKMKGMAGALSATVDVKKGGRRTIAGYGCDEWVMTIGGMSKTESCLSTEVPFPLEASGQYRDLQDTFRAMGGGGQYLSDLQEKTKDMKGFALSTVTTLSVLGKTNIDTNEVTEIKKGALPAGAFDMPSGYKQKDSPMKAMKKK